MKSLPIILLSFIAFAGCITPEGPVTPATPDPIAIDPVITKATDVDFELGDALGLSVFTEEGTYADNALLSYDGTQFSSDLCWYLEPERTASLFAYYPYQEQGLGGKFSVQLDQSAGIGGSDLIFGEKKNVKPSKNSVSMIFKHQLTKLTVYTANLSEEKIVSVRLLELYPGATIAPEDHAVSVDQSTEKVGIKTHNVLRDTTWEAIVIPQTASMKLEVTLEGGKTLTQQLKEETLAVNTRYSISAVVYNNNMKIITYGQILPWLEGGDISGLEEDNPEPPKPKDFEEFEDHFVYFGESYNIVTMKDGRTWMAENLRYVPAGKTVVPLSDSYDADEDAIWYPASFGIQEEKAVVTPSSDKQVIARQGLLYSAKAALAGETLPYEEWGTAENNRGICPQGWHIPLATEWIDLVGACATSSANNSSAPYFDSNLNGANLDKMNQDGFNIFPYPFLNKGKYNGLYLNTDNKRSFYGYCSNSFLLTSSTHISSGSAKEQQIFCAMITNNATKTSFNVSYGNLVSGYYVRCIKDKE